MKKTFFDNFHILIQLWLIILFTSGMPVSHAGTYAGTVDASESGRYEAVLAAYEQALPLLTTNDFGEPITVKSHADNNSVTGVVHAELPYGFGKVRELLASSSNWCKVSALHINVKSCTVSNTPDHDSGKNKNLHLYIGSKEYQDPDDAFQFDYDYQVPVQSGNYIRVTLNANSGPLDSKNYRITIQAIPLDDDSSFIELRYSAKYGAFARFLLKTYLATAGRNKVGFTKIGMDENGNARYIKGIEGIIERNAMRYLLAIHSYLGAQSYPPSQRFEAGLERWYEFTRIYHRQLYEIDKEEYLENKRRERENQKAMQLAIIKASAQQDASQGSDFQL